MLLERSRHSRAPTGITSCHGVGCCGAVVAVIIMAGVGAWEAIETLHSSAIVPADDDRLCVTTVRTLRGSRTALVRPSPTTAGGGVNGQEDGDIGGKNEAGRSVGSLQVRGLDAVAGRNPLHSNTESDSSRAPHNCFAASLTDESVETAPTPPMYDRVGRMAAVLPHYLDLASSTPTWPWVSAIFSNFFTQLCASAGLRCPGNHLHPSISHHSSAGLTDIECYHQCVQPTDQPFRVSPRAWAVGRSLLQSDIQAVQTVDLRQLTRADAGKGPNPRLQPRRGQNIQAVQTIDLNIPAINYGSPIQAIQTVNIQFAPQPQGHSVQRYYGQEPDSRQGEDTPAHVRLPSPL